MRKKSFICLILSLLFIIILSSSALAVLVGYKEVTVSGSTTKYVDTTNTVDSINVVCVSIDSSTGAFVRCYDPDGHFLFELEKLTSKDTGKIFKRKNINGPKGKYKFQFDMLPSDECVFDLELKDGTGIEID